MGRIFYGTSDQAIEIEGRLLAHVQAVVITKLRRGESFSLTCRAADGSRETMWVNSAIPIRIVLDEETDGRLDRELLVQLVEAANSNRGLDVTELMAESASARRRDLPRAA